VRLFAVILLLLTPFSPAQTPKQMIFSFPANTDRMPSAVGHFLATYKEIPTKPDSVKQYLFSITDTFGKPLAQHSFNRSIEGAWSPYSEQVYANDFMGSAQIDCLVWGAGGERLTSLTEVLLHDPNSGPIEGGGAKPPETPENSRFELTCHGWAAKDKVLLDVTGDTWAGGEFKYRLVYDLRAKRFSWE